jgi:hypothetical protein
MLKRSSIFFLSILCAAAFAGTTAHAETPAVQKALENVKESLDTLITTKDEKVSDDLSLRIDTYRKVLAFATTETKDLKVKLLALEGLDADPAAVEWKKAVLAELAGALDRYASEEKYLDENEGSITIERIKSIADAFKEWRDTEYAAAANQVKELLLINQQSGTLDTAGRRYLKVEEDVAKIQRAKLKGVSDLVKLMERAHEALSQAEDLNGNAHILFTESYFPILDTGTSTATSTASTTPEHATSTGAVETPIQATTTSTAPFIPIESTATSSVTSTISSATTTASSSLQSSVPPLPPSIKDLVKQSLVKTKEAYKVFIEMSNFVRELLK